MSGPIAPTTPSPQQTPGTKGQVVPIQSLPDALKNVARAMHVEGEVVQQNQDGSTRIRTPQGDIDVAIRGRQPQPGTQVEVDIPAGNPPRNVTLRPAPAQPSAPAPSPQTPETPATTPLPPVNTTQPAPAPTNGNPATRPVPAPDNLPTPGTPPVQETKAAPLPPLPPLRPGDTVTLVPLPSDDTPQKPAPSLPVVPTPDASASVSTQTQATQTAQKAQGSLLTTLIQAVKTVLPDNSPALQTVNALLTGNEKPANPLSQPTQNQTPQAMPVFITPLSAKIVAITLPSGQTLTMPTGETPIVQTGAPVAATPALQRQTLQTPATMPPTLTVIVEQVTPQNQPVVPVPVSGNGATQNFILQSPPATVPVGTQVTLQPLPVSTAVLSSATAPAAGSIIPAPQTLAAPNSLPPLWRSATPLMQASSLWPVMDDIFQSFYQATPQAAQILARTIPSPANPGNLGPSVLLFAAALKAGDLQGWIGEKKLEMIQKLGKGDLISRLSGETTSLSGNADTPATDWKSFPVPMLWQNEISKVLFHVRREPSENEQDNPETGTRFIMDLSLTRMGAVQLDGLVRGQRLDLVVRTEAPVSAAMQEAMQKAYADALDGTHIYGEIGFQGDLKHMLQVLKRDDRMIASV